METLRLVLGAAVAVLAVPTALAAIVLLVQHQLRWRSVPRAGDPGSGEWRPQPRTAMPPLRSRARTLVSVLAPTLVLCLGGLCLLVAAEPATPVTGTPRYQVVVVDKEAPRRGTVCDVGYRPAPGETRVAAGVRETLVRCADVPAVGTTVVMLEHGTTTHFAVTEDDVERAAQRLRGGRTALTAVLGGLLVLGALAWVGRSLRRAR